MSRIEKLFLSAVIAIFGGIAIISIIGIAVTVYRAAQDPRIAFFLLILVCVVTVLSYTIPDDFLDRIILFKKEKEND